MERIDLRLDQKEGSKKRGLGWAECSVNKMSFSEERFTAGPYET